MRHLRSSSSGSGSSSNKFSRCCSTSLIINHGTHFSSSTSQHLRQQHCFSSSSSSLLLKPTSINFMISSFSNPFSSASSSTKNNKNNNGTMITEDELAMMETDELSRELSRFGWHQPNKQHLELVVKEMITRGSVISVKTIREAIKLCYLSGDRKLLYNLAIELFLGRVYGGSSENDMKMLGLPEELVDCAALCEVGDPLQKLISITRTTEATLRSAHSADVVPGLEMSLFRALWRCFVILKNVRLLSSSSSPSQRRHVVAEKSTTSTPSVVLEQEELHDNFAVEEDSSSSASVRRNKELEVMETARRIFDLLTIVNKKILNLSNTSSSSSTSFTNNSTNFSSSSSTTTSADENLAFKQLCRLISLRVLYSDPQPSSSSFHQQQYFFGDDGEAEYFRLLFSRKLFQADVSGGPAARYLSLIKTCENGARPDIATEYFEQYEVAHPFLVKPMESLSSSSTSTKLMLLPFQVEQFELVLKSYWNLLLKCGEHKKVVKTLVKYLDIFEEYNTYQLPAPLLSVAMRAVGEVQESKVAAKTMASLLKSFSVGGGGGTSSSSSSTTRNTQNDNDDDFSVSGNEISQEAEQEQEEMRRNNINSSNSTTSSSHTRPPTKYEMLTCLTALAKCGHPSFDQALETCLQERLIDTSSPVRVAELRLQYALNDPIDSLQTVQDEIQKCEDAGFSIKQDFRCAGLILQILLRLDEETFLDVFKDIVGEVNHHRATSSGATTGGIREIPSSWVDWLVVWSLRRRYELTTSQQQYILDVIDHKKSPSSFIVPQSELIRRDFDETMKKMNKNKKNNTSQGKSDHQFSTTSDPRCVWPKRKSAISALKISTTKSNTQTEQQVVCSSCIGEAFTSFAHHQFIQTAKSPLVEKLVLLEKNSSNHQNAVLSDANEMLNRMASMKY